MTTAVAPPNLSQPRYGVVIPRNALCARDPFDLEPSLRQTAFLSAGRITTAGGVRVCSAEVKGVAMTDRPWPLTRDVYVTSPGALAVANASLTRAWRSGR